VKRRGDPDRCWTHRPGVLQRTDVFDPERIKRLNDKGNGMESQAFSAADYSLRTIDLIPPDDFEDEDDTDVRWLEYCRMASTVPRDEVLAVVLDELNSPVSPLFDLIDDALATPHPEPDRPRTNVTDLIKLGQAILNMVAMAVDDQVSMRTAIGGAR
jgi:hypothetical protein